MDPPPGSAWSAHPRRGSPREAAGHTGGSLSYRPLCTSPGPPANLSCPSSLAASPRCPPRRHLLPHCGTPSWSPGRCCCWPAPCPGCELPLVLRGNIERFLCCATHKHRHTQTRCRVSRQAAAKAKKGDHTQY